MKKSFVIPAKAGIHTSDIADVKSVDPGLRRDDGIKVVIILFLLLWAFPAYAAVDPSEYMADPALEARAESLYGQVRCVVCQSESIADSNAAVAHDMRAMIRGRLKAGDGEEDILHTLQDRYGDAVLMKPPVKAATWLLWAGPFIVLLGGAVVAWRLFGRRAA